MQVVCGRLVVFFTMKNHIKEQSPKLPIFFLTRKIFSEINEQFASIMQKILSAREKVLKYTRSTILIFLNFLKKVVLIYAKIAQIIVHQRLPYYLIDTISICILHAFNCSICIVASDFATSNASIRFKIFMFKRKEKVNSVRGKR